MVHRAEQRMVGLLEYPHCQHLLIGGQILQRQAGRRRYVLLGKPGDHFGAGQIRLLAGDDRGQFRHMDAAIGHAPVFLLGLQVGAADDIEHRVPVGIGHCGIGDGTVGRAQRQLVIVGKGRAVRDPFALQRQVHAAVGPEKGDTAFQHRQVDMLAAAAAFTGKQRSGDRLRCGIGGELVADQCLDIGKAGGMALQGHESRHRLHHMIIGGTV